MEQNLPTAASGLCIVSRFVQVRQCGDQRRGCVLVERFRPGEWGDFVAVECVHEDVFHGVAAKDCDDFSRPNWGMIRLNVSCEKRKSARLWWVIYAHRHASGRRVNDVPWHACSVRLTKDSWRARCVWVTGIQWHARCVRVTGNKWLIYGNSFGCANTSAANTFEMVVDRFVSRSSDFALGCLPGLENVTNTKTLGLCPIPRKLDLSALVQFAPFMYAPNFHEAIALSIRGWSPLGFCSCPIFVQSSSS